MKDLMMLLLISGGSGIIFPRLGWWVLIVGCVLNFVWGHY